MTTTEALSPATPSIPEKTPWGLAMTTLWIVAAVVGMMIATVIGIFAFFPFDVVQTPEFAKDARAFGILSLLAAAGVVAVLMLAARLRPGWTVTEYLGLIWPGTREVMIAFAVTVVFVVAFDVFTY